MADLPISAKIADELLNIARREHRSLEQVVTEMIAQYHASESSRRIDRRPLHDEDIDVPSDIQDRSAYREAVRQIRPKLYEIAREYWQSVGDQERLAFSDEQLDVQFWLIDNQGIPRLKTERDNIMLPPDPLETLVGLIDDAPPDLSSSVRKTMEEHYGAKADDERSA